MYFDITRGDGLNFAEDSENDSELHLLHDQRELGGENSITVNVEKTVYDSSFGTNIAFESIYDHNYFQSTGNFEQNGSSETSFNESSYSEKNVRCKVCGKEFSSKFPIVTVCNDCANIIINKTKEEDESTFQCDECGKFLASKSSLKNTKSFMWV